MLLTINVQKITAIENKTSTLKYTQNRCISKSVEISASLDKFYNELESEYR